MRKNLIALVLVSIAFMSGSGRPQQLAPVSAVALQGMIPFHCQAPVHAAEFFAGAVGVAIGLGGEDRHPQMCLLVRVSQASTAN